MKPIATLVFLSLTIMLFTVSCSVGKHGMFNKKKSTDTTATQQRVAAIKNIEVDLFDSFTFTGHANTPIQYRLLQPHTNAAKKFPLVLVFHGSGAVGNDNKKQLGLLAKYWALPTIHQQYAAFVVVPQFATRSSNYFLDSNRQVLTSGPEPCVQTVLQLVDSLKNVLPIDEKRIYVIGYSMGASTAINALTLRPGLFAAGISIAGIPQFDKLQQLSTIPIWMVHGNADTENTIESDLLFFKEMQLQHGNKLLFWELNKTAHNDIVPEMILGNRMASWLFGNKRK